MDGMTRSLTRNIGDGWKETGEDGRERRDRKRVMKKRKKKKL